MTKSTKKKSSKPNYVKVEKRPKVWNGLNGFEFTLDDTTFWVNAFSEAGSLDTIRYDKTKDTYVIDHNEDTGGTGKNAVKRVTIPLAAWLERYAREV